MSGVLSARQGSREELGGEASPFKRRGRQRVCSHGPRLPPSCESKAPVRWVERPKCGGLVRNPLHSFDTHADPIVWNSSVAEASFHLAAVSSPEANFRLKAAFPAAGLGGPLQHKAVRAAMDRHRGGHVDAHRSAPQLTAAFGTSGRISPHTLQEDPISTVRPCRCEAPAPTSLPLIPMGSADQAIEEAIDWRCRRHTNASAEL